MYADEYLGYLSRITANLRQRVSDYKVSINDRMQVSKCIYIIITTEEQDRLKVLRR